MLDISARRDILQVGCRATWSEYYVCRKVAGEYPEAFSDMEELAVRALEIFGAETRITLNGHAIDHDMIKMAGEKLAVHENDSLQELWEDLTEEQREVTRNMAGSGQPAGGQSDHRVIDPLIDRGIIRKRGDRLEMASAVVRSFVTSEAGQRSNALVALFSTPELFAKNSKELLQLRFASLPPIDSDLADYLKAAIDNLHKPKVLIRMFPGKEL